jgi:hypothetical protein
MSRPVVYNWPIPSTSSICLTQNTAGAQNLIFNGVLASTANSFQPSVFLNGIVRKVSITSANNLSARSFTVTGIDAYGDNISETINGPNAGTVQTASNFSAITSVFVNGAVNAVRVGTGNTGATAWFQADINRSYSSIVAQVVITGTIDCSYVETLDNIQENDSPQAFFTIPEIENATTSKIASKNNPAWYHRLLINSSGADGELVFTIMQSGIT